MVVQVTFVTLRLGGSLQLGPVTNLTNLAPLDIFDSSSGFPYLDPGLWHPLEEEWSVEDSPIHLADFLLVLVGQPLLNLPELLLDFMVPPLPNPRSDDLNRDSVTLGRLLDMNLENSFFRICLCLFSYF